MSAHAKLKNSLALSRNGIGVCGSALNGMCAILSTCRHAAPSSSLRGACSRVDPQNIVHLFGSIRSSSSLSTKSTMLSRINGKTLWRLRQAPSVHPKVSTLWPRSISTGLFSRNDSTKPHGIGGVSEAGMDFARYLLSRYYEKDEDVDLAAKALSPGVLSSMMLEVTKSGSNIDFKTADMLIRQAVKQGESGLQSIELILNSYVTANNAAAAARTLLVCDPSIITIPETTCTRILNRLVDQYKWTEAFTTLVYMIDQGNRCDTDTVKKVVGVLMQTNTGTVMALELVRLMVAKQRGDLISCIDFSTAKSFSRTLEIEEELGLRAEYKELLQAPLQEAMQACIVELQQHGWVNNNAVKLLVGLALTADHMHLAQNFLRDSLAAVEQRAATPSTQTPGAYDTASDALQLRLRLLTAFAAIDSALNQDDRGELLRPKYTALSLRIVDELWQEPFATQVLQSGVTSAVALMHAHWALSFRARTAAVDVQQHAEAVSVPTASSIAGAAAVAGAAVGDVPYAGVTPDATLRKCYNKLSKFWRDEYSGSTQEFSCAPGYERRCLRTLCDSFGLLNKLVPVPGAFPIEYNVRVGKHHPHDVPRIKPLGLVDMLREDAGMNPRSMQFDGLPQHWDKARAALMTLGDEELEAVVNNLLELTRRSRPSPTYALLYLGLLRERGIPLPLGSLARTLRMCHIRNDTYSMLEVMHLDVTERELAKSGAYRKKLRQYRPNAKYNFGVALNEGDEWSTYRGPASEMRADELEVFQWKRSLEQFYGNKRAATPDVTYKDCFAEMFALLKRAGKEEDVGLNTSLLCFLTASGYDNVQLRKVARRIFWDKELPVSSVACLAMSMTLYKWISPKLQMFKFAALSDQPHYLFASAPGLNKLADAVKTLAEKGALGDEFLKSFLSSWSELSTEEGVEDLYDLVSEAVDQKGELFANLINSKDTDALDAVIALGIYCSYLTSARLGEHRRAYDLLFSLDNAVRAAATAAGVPTPDEVQAVGLRKRQLDAIRARKAERLRQFEEQAMAEIKAAENGTFFNAINSASSSTFDTSIGAGAESRLFYKPATVMAPAPAVPEPVVASIANGISRLNSDPSTAAAATERTMAAAVQDELNNTTVFKNEYDPNRKNANAWYKQRVNSSAVGAKGSTMKSSGRPANSFQRKSGPPTS